MFNILGFTGYISFLGIVIGGLNIPILLCIGALAITNIALYRRERYINQLEGDVDALTRYAETVSEETDRHMHEYLDRHLCDYRVDGVDIYTATQRCIDAYWTNGSRHYGFDPIPEIVNGIDRDSD